MKITHHELSHLIQSGTISPEKIDKALIVTKLIPSPNAWKHFLGKLLFLLGALAICSSVLFFIAYNWDGMGRFAKFSLVEGLIVASIFLYWQVSRKSDVEQGALLSKVALLAASIFLGVLLAFYGQTYQTGADTWQLFFTWCVLMLPWTIISRFPALWILWLALLNLSIVLYFQTFGGLFGLVLNSYDSMLWTVAGVNTLALIFWEFLGNRWKWLSESWATRFIAVTSGTALSLLVIDSIFSRKSSIMPVVLWVAALIVVYFVYRKRKPDLFMLALACLSTISVILSFFGKVLFDVMGGEISAFIVLTILVILLGGASAIWLKGIHKEHLSLEEDKA